MSILIENVTKHFGKNIVLDDINLEIKTGSLVALLGGSGSGKSTLLRVVAGFEEPNTGRVWLNGKDSSSLSIQEKEIGFVFQAYALFQHLTVYENIAFGLSCNSSFFEFDFASLSLINWFSKGFIGPILQTRGIEQSSYKYNIPLNSNDLRKKKSLTSNSILIDPSKSLTNRNQFPEGSVKLLWDSNTHFDKTKNLSQQENYSSSKEKIKNQKLFSENFLKLLPRKDSLNQKNHIENNYHNNTTNFFSLKKTSSDSTYPEFSSNIKSNQDKLHWNSQSSSSDTLRSVEELLRLVGLEDLAYRYPNQLSGGQCQRVALARALAVQPKVLLLDEPFGALDTKVRKNLRKWLRQLHERVGVTTLFVTHDHQEAMEVANEIVVLDKGRVKHSLNSPQKIFSRLTTLSQKT